MVSEKQRQNRERLFTIMRENPDLPVIPFVDGEIVAGDDFGSWMGSWGASHVDEYLFPEDDLEPAISRAMMTFSTRLKNVSQRNSLINCLTARRSAEKSTILCPGQRRSSSISTCRRCNRHE